MCLDSPGYFLNMLLIFEYARILSTISTLLRPVWLRSQFLICENSAKKKNFVIFVKCPIKDVWRGCEYVIFNIHFPKVHRNALRKITIYLLHFWGIYDVNLWEKNVDRSTAYSCRTKYLYINFIVFRENNRHSWKVNKSSKTF